MKFFKKSEKKTEKLPMPSNVKNGFRRYCVTVLALALCSTLVLPASATGGDPLTVVNNLSEMEFELLSDEEIEAELLSGGNNNEKHH